MKVTVYQIPHERIRPQFMRTKEFQNTERRLMCGGSKKWNANTDFDYYMPVAEVSINPDMEMMEGWTQPELEDYAEITFQKMQRVDESRNPDNDPDVKDLTGANLYHSMMVSDIVEIDGTYFMVDNSGFTKILIT